MDSKQIFDYIYMLEITNKELYDNNIKLTTRNNELIEELADFKKVSIMVNINKQLKEKENQINLLENEIRNLKNKINNIDVVNKTTYSNQKNISIKNTDVILESNSNNVDIGLNVNNKTKINHDTNKSIELHDRVPETACLVAEVPSTKVEANNSILNVPSTKVEPIETIVDVSSTKVEPIETIVDVPSTKVEPIETVVDVPSTKVEITGFIDNTDPITSIQLDEIMDNQEQVLKPKKKKSKVKECQIIKYKNTEYLLNVETNEIYELTDKKLNNQIGILSKGKVKFNKT